MLWINSKKPVANYHRICLCLAHFTSSSSTCFHCIFSIYAVRQFQRAASSSLLLLLCCFFIPSLPLLCRRGQHFGLTAFCHLRALPLWRSPFCPATQLQPLSTSALATPCPRTPPLQPSLLVQPNPESLSPISELVQHYYELFSCVPLPHFFRAILFICHAKGTCMDHTL